MTHAVDGASILLTGGTGSFGGRFAARVLSEHSPRSLTVYSRDELKQSELRRSLPDDRIRWIIGDVRDRDRLRGVMRGIDVVVHAAALKQVASDEANPTEAIATNVGGALNVVSTAIDAGVKRALLISSDKACSPLNLYGQTKAVAEKLFVWANSDGPGLFSAVRYGNVAGSRGSVIPLWREQAKQGVLTLTDPNATRFWLTLDQGVDFVLWALGNMRGGEVFVPRLPSVSVRVLAEAVAQGAAWRVVGLGAAEKPHELLVSRDEARRAAPTETGWAIYPSVRNVMSDGWEYGSSGNDWWLDGDALKAAVEKV